MKHIFKFAFVFIGLLLFSICNAQEFGPQKGQKMVSMNFGKSVNFGDLSFSEINQSTFSNNPANITNPNSNSYNNHYRFNIIGVEFKYFITNQIALNLAGSGALTTNPSRDFVTGVEADENATPGTYFPSYRMMEGQTTGQFHIDLGADYYFTTKVNRVFPYLGVQLNTIYGQTRITDGYRGLNNDNEVISTFPDRHGEFYGLGASINGGIDYFLAEGLFIGLNIKPVSYMYVEKRIFHQEGLNAQDAASYNLKFFTNPVVKLGFKF